jgi:uroporphyrinogen-III decarboxylase
MEKGAAYCIEKGKFNVDMGIKMLRLNDSGGNMSVISPGQWKDFVFPHFKMICDELHHCDPEVRIYCHICGDVMPILEKLVETGVDCIGPLDPFGGVDPSAVRNIVGDEVALLGGENTLSFINEDPEHIVSESRYCIESAGSHGGYVLSSGCVLPRDSKAENIGALRDAVIRYGVYDHGNLMHTHR